MSPFGRRPRRALEERRAGEARDERVGGRATSSRRRAPPARSVPSTITPIRSASAAASSKSCVTRIVGSASSRSSSCELGPDRRLRVGVERRERLVEQQHLRVAARARARARPAGARRPRARGRGRARDPRSGTARAAPAPTFRAARRSGRSRRRRGAGRARTPGTGSRPAARSGGTVDARRRVEPGRRRRPRRPAAGAGAGRRRRAAPSSCPPPTARRARAVSPSRDGQLDGRVEAAKGMGEVEPERHRVRSLTESRTPPLISTSTALIASATSKSRSNCS